MYKQIIIVRKDLDLSPGKLAVQVAHASMAFLLGRIQCPLRKEGSLYNEFQLLLNAELYKEWLCGIHTKICLKAKNKNDLLKAKNKAEEMGLVENRDFYLIRDCCLTELSPEEEDGTTLTCIGFIPMEESDIKPISKKYQLYS